ncbi:MAG: calcium/sodium antiporter [Planctomycetes bacterium]|nr:calcium/sodium antiporter [Planctomycetota bacterium]
MLFLQLFLFFSGIASLYFGAEWLVKGASRFACFLNIKPVVIGLTIVAFGTSAPELTTGIIAGIKHLNDIALGNVVGSNIANIGLVLGITATLFPLTVEMKLLRREIPIILGISALLYLMCRNGTLGRLEGCFLVGGIIIYTCYIYRQSDKESTIINEEYLVFINKKNTFVIDLLFIFIGLATLVGGAHLLVTSAVYLARSFGVSELIIGLSVVAVGTSLPELAISTVAAFRKEADISIGNVLGSNIFNILVVLGITAIIHPLKINASSLRSDMPVMIIFSLLLIPMIKRKFILRRGEGIFLLFGYCLYIVFLYKKCFS